MSDLTRTDFDMAQAFAATFATTSGQVVLKELDKMYFTKNLFEPSDPYASHVNIGSHLVVAAIYQLIALAHDPRATVSPISTEE
jgi:hypothetical protein